MMNKFEVKNMDLYYGSFHALKNINIARFKRGRTRLKIEVPHIDKTLIMSFLNFRKGIVEIFCP